MVIYGVCVSEINNLNAEKAEQFLETLKGTKAGSIAEEYFISKEDNEHDLQSFLYDYEGDGGYYGLAAFLRDIIASLEEIDISCDDPDGVHYLGLSIDTPWKYNEKTRNMSEEEYTDILQ
ncbi:MAG: hypothetical protein J6K26_01225, partial [Lachnospiraceae bacterium]|nr:hypothetical protein [Lachnospiraceae bacterium]